MRPLIAVALIWIAGCGRIGFDASDASGARDTGTDAAMATSCNGLASTCGPTGTSPCCESPVVTGGTFYRSYDVGTDNAYPDMSFPATVSDFRLDKYEVTVGRFRQFVAAGLGTQQNPPPAGAGARTLNGMTNQGGWDPSWNANLRADTAALVAAVKCDATYETWTDTPTASDNRPMSCITWYEAMAFCAWDGGFLPTEAEWNYAASGGSLQRAYPWSSPAGSTTIDCTVTNFGGPNWPTTACVGAANNVGSVSPQGDGLWGQSDLGGNTWEWVLDWYTTPYPTPCADCANLSPAPERVIRGGGFVYAASYLRAAYRNSGPPAIGFVNFFYVGVRCARAR